MGFSSRAIGDERATAINHTTMKLLKTLPAIIGVDEPLQFNSKNRSSK